MSPGRLTFFPTQTGDGEYPDWGRRLDPNEIAQGEGLALTTLFSFVTSPLIGVGPADFLRPAMRQEHRKIDSDSAEDLFAMRDCYCFRQCCRPPSVSFVCPKDVVDRPMLGPVSDDRVRLAPFGVANPEMDLIW
jgi:hypothetical protein